MPSNYKKDDITYGIVDFDDDYVTEAWLVDQFVGNHLFTWGPNFQGVLGLGDTTDRNSPVQVGSLVNWKQISTGNFHAVATKTDGTLWVWGWGAITAGLGLGNYNSYSSPIQIGSLTNWKQVSTNLYSNAAIKTDGTLWTWGWNSDGQLGLGVTSTTSNTPVQVGTLTNWKYVDTSWYHMLAIKTDGTLWAWGDNPNGQLGLGDTINRSSPVQVGSMTDWKQVSTNVNNTFAIKTDNTIWAWGRNVVSPAGEVDPLTPTSFSNSNNWKQVSTAQAQVAFIKTDGSLWVAGNNLRGQLGLGNTTNSTSLVQVGTLTNWKKVVVQGSGLGSTPELAPAKTVATKTDGTLWTWGGNSQGQLGLGDAIDRSSPVQVGTLTNWKESSTGANNIYAITYADIT
jgi:alpha-tubulin suppressor-like RCC1 family protein